MIKKLYIFFLVVIILIIASILYLNFIGLETKTFNKLIKNEVKSYNEKIDIKLEKVKLLLNIKNLSIKIQTKDPVLVYKKKAINIEKISSNISIASYFKKEFGIENLFIETKKNKIHDLIYLNSSINNNPRIFILSKFIKKGEVKAIINLKFDKKGKVKPDYIINGRLEDGKLQLLKLENIDKINFDFEFKKNNLKLSNITFDIEKTKFYSDSLLINKVNTDYNFKGNIKNERTNLNSKLLKLISLHESNYVDIANSEFENFSEFNFAVTKKFKIKNFNIKSKINIYDLIYLENKEIFNKYFSEYKDNVKFKKINLNIDYKDKKLKVSGDGNYNINNQDDKITFNFDKYKDTYDFEVKINLNKSKILLEAINYIKKENDKALLFIKGKYNNNKNLIFNEINYSENKNKIIINNLKLNQKYKVINFNNIILNYFTVNNIFNELKITYNKPDYTIIGKNYDALKIVKEITDTDSKSNFFNVFDNINSQIIINLSKVYLDEENIAKNFNGSLTVKKNKIIDLDINSLFSKNEKFFITIKSLNNKKVTTLYSDRAVPFVRNFKFIRGFEKGSLDYSSLENNGISKSQIKIYDFKIKEFPALANILRLASFDAVSIKDFLTGKPISFDEFEMNFETKGELMTIDEIYSIGPALSILMSGYIEKDKLISLRGTLVPATKLNKIIGKIKVIGDILVGNKKGEGVFGVSFKIKGPPKNLKTTVNPIKSLTPRFITRTLEKIKKSNQ